MSMCLHGDAIALVSCGDCYWRVFQIGHLQTWDSIYTRGYDLLDKQDASGTEFPLYDGQGDTYQTLTASGSYVLSGDVMNDFGQHFAGASGTNDLSYQWRASSGYRTEGDGPWTGSYNESIALATFIRQIRQILPMCDARRF